MNNCGQHYDCQTINQSADFDLPHEYRREPLYTRRTESDVVDYRPPVKPVLEQTAGKQRFYFVKLHVSSVLLHGPLEIAGSNLSLYTSRDYTDP